MISRQLFLWKQAPFLRLLLPLVLGILLQWFVDPPPRLGWLLLLSTLCASCCPGIAGIYFQFHLPFIRGLLLQFAALALGMVLTQTEKRSSGQLAQSTDYHHGDVIIGFLDQPLTEKKHSYKGSLNIECIGRNHHWKKTSGHLIIYLPKEKGFSAPLQVTDRIMIRTTVLPIENSGNPGEFDLVSYCRQQQIGAQILLRKDQWLRIPSLRPHRLISWVFFMRDKIIVTLKKFIPGSRESGLAEAMFIGYKDELDRSLIQSYTQTGVVHIIAISGLHLALIYALLRWALAWLRPKRLPWLKPVLIIAALWAFSLVSGASASVLRSAVMFSCVVIGQAFSKDASVFNTLFASAFLLLCYNPLWIWDLGFQLSYSAVLSIVIFSKPIEQILSLHSKIPGLIWKSISLTLAAQILPLPICLLQFHQFPNHFLWTNLVAVPLSSLILLGEIIVCVLSIYSPLAVITGIMVSKLITLLNWFIAYTAHLPFALTEGIEINWVQALLLYLFIASVVVGLRQKNRGLPGISAIFMIIILTIRWQSFEKANRQRTLIVYRLPTHEAIDCFIGRRLVYRSDSVAPGDQQSVDYYLKPSRALFRMRSAAPMLQIPTLGSLCLLGSKRILVIDQPAVPIGASRKIKLDCLVISHRARVSPKDLSAFVCALYVLDASLPRRVINDWKKECASRGLPCYFVAEKGAFVKIWD